MSRSDSTPGRNILLIVFYILTALLLAIALVYAIEIGFLSGIKGMFSSDLPALTGRIARHPRVVLGAMIILLSVFLMAAGSWLERAAKKQCIIAGIVMLAFLLTLQFVFIYGMNIIQNTDAFEVQDQALAIERGLMHSVDYEHSNYFRKYGNNDLYLILCIGMYHICDFLRIARWDKAFAIFNMFCIDSGIFLACHILSLLKGRRVALQAFLLNVLNPLNYLFLHWTYTCTYSIPLMLLGMYLSVLIYLHRDRRIRNAVLTILIGLICVVGYYLRPTAVFPIIAVIVCLIAERLHALRMRRRTKKAGVSPAAYQECTDKYMGNIQARQTGIQVTASLQKKSRKEENDHTQANTVPAAENGGNRQQDMRTTAHHSTPRTFLFNCLVLILTVCVMAGASGLISRTAARYDTNNTYNFPIEHWLMVGMTGTGRLSTEDIKYTASYETKSEKKAADLAALKEAVSSRSPSQTIRFFLRKIRLTFSDGTGEYYSRTTQSDNSTMLIYELVSGSRRGGLMLYCHAFRIVLLSLAILGILREIRHGADDLPFAVFAVTVLGGLVFYLFWEGKPVYSLPFMPFLAFLACDAYNPLSQAYHQTIQHSHRIRHLQQALLAGVLAAVIIAVSSDSLYILNRQTYTEWSIVCSNPTIKKTVLLKKGSTMEQDFFPRYVFNRIRLSVSKRGKKYGMYRLRLMSGGQILYILDVNSADIVDGSIILSFPEIEPGNGQRFTVSIENLTGGKSSIKWYVRNSYITSQYDGDRYIDGEVQHGDTLMDVYLEY